MVRSSIHYMGEALDRLEQSQNLERDRLIRLEFGLIPALGHEGEQRATSLYAALMSDQAVYRTALSGVPARQSRARGVRYGDHKRRGRNRMARSPPLPTTTRNPARWTDRPRRVHSVRR